MHFRIRKNVVQLIRVRYDAGRKKGVNTVVGTVKLVNPVLTNELQAALTPAELAEFRAWLSSQHRSELLREELTALTLAEAMARATRWFEREGDTQAARIAASEIVVQWQALRRRLAKAGLLD